MTNATNNNAQATNTSEAMAKKMAERAQQHANRNDQVSEDAWYTTTTAKVAGAVVVGAAVGIAGYLAWQHFTGANTVTGDTTV